MKKKKEKKKPAPSNPTAIHMAALRRPHTAYMRDLRHHQVIVEGQRKFLAAQDAQQEMINRMRLGTLRGNPYIQ